MVEHKCYVKIVNQELQCIHLLTPVCFGSPVCLADRLNGDGRDDNVSSSSIFSMSNTSDAVFEAEDSECLVTRFCLTVKDSR